MGEHNTEKPNALVGLEVCKIELMHDGERMFFTWFLTSGLIFVLKRGEGLSPAGGEIWQLSLARRKHATGVRSGHAPRRED